MRAVVICSVPDVPRAHAPSIKHSKDTQRYSRISTQGYSRYSGCSRGTSDDLLRHSEPLQCHLPNGNDRPLAVEQLERPDLRLGRAGLRLALRRAVLRGKRERCRSALAPHMCARACAPAPAPLTSSCTPTPTPTPTHTHARTHTHTNAHTHTRARAHTWRKLKPSETHSNTRTHAHTCTYTRTHDHAHTRRHADARNTLPPPRVHACAIHHVARCGVDMLQTSGVRLVPITAACMEQCAV
jgi:hypothetical protein